MRNPYLADGLSFMESREEEADNNQHEQENNPHINENPVVVRREERSRRSHALRTRSDISARP